MKMFGDQKGFSLIELLLVVVIIGVVAAMAIPAYQKGIRAAENGSVFSILRTISSTQIQFFSQNSRFATLAEVNTALSNSIGVTTVDKVVRGRYVFEMPPGTTPATLAEGYTISAVRSLTPDDTAYRYELDQSGKIRRILPAGGNQD